MVTTTTDNQRVLSGSPRESRSEPIGMSAADLTSIAALAGLAVVPEKYQALMPDILAYREQHDIQILHQKRENEESKTQELRSAFNLHVAWSFLLLGKRKAGSLSRYCVTSFSVISPRLLASENASVSISCGTSLLISTMARIGLVTR